MGKRRNRICKHVRVRARDLLPHELNPRLHSEAQKAALAALLDEVGFARSLLAYELPDGRLKLIDGHLRRELGPDDEVEVEVLDVNDAEARKLLLAIDPLAQLAHYDADVLTRLRGLVEPESPAIRSLWEAVEKVGQDVEEKFARSRTRDLKIPEQFLILIECGSEEEQVKLLQRFRAEGLNCKALTS